MYEFLVILRINSDYSPKQHKPDELCIGYGLFSLRFRLNLYHLGQPQLQSVKIPPLAHTPFQQMINCSIDAQDMQAKNSNLIYHNS